VRDLLLGRNPNDFDIATSAYPEETAALFPRVVLDGAAHGTVRVLTQGGPVEVTTYRSDGEYPDGRHPASVRFLSSLEEDLSRRDFTVNAMALSADGVLTDPFRGASDLKRKIIRCVGEAEIRFREDALRMLRAVRFSAQLGFSLEEKTAAAIAACAPLAASLSAERVRDEIEKTICSPRPELASSFYPTAFSRPGWTPPLFLPGTIPGWAAFRTNPCSAGPDSAACSYRRARYPVFRHFSRGCV
jgi:tRNA nucleotidyltransferase (CCA-adding enzyme)